MKTKILSILALLLMTVTQGAWAFSGSGTSESPYLIASTTDWNNLVTAVNGGNTYSDKYFKMTANVGTVSTWMTGTFSGTFDGDGNTLTVGYSTSARYCAPFGTLGGTVKKLRVAGTLSSSAKNFGGIAAQVASGKTATIQNCRVSATLTSTLSGDNSSGGFVGVVWSGGTLNITGCAFTGSLQGSGATACGGFLGYKEGTCSMTDCLFAPASVTMSTEYAGTFSRPSAPTMTRCYYTRTLRTAQGLQARTIAAGDYVSSLSVTKGSATATYDVSGITVYSGGIDFNDGSTTTFYGGSGQNVSLALTAETRTGYQFSQYAASQGTLASETTDTPTLTMPAANSTANDVVTISAEYTKNELALNEVDDNAEKLAEWNGYEADVTLTRTLQTGGWNTFCLPFGMTLAAFKTAIGDDQVQVKELASSSLTGETLTLNFADAESIVAGTPYLVKVTDAVANPTFDGVTISKTAQPKETTYANFVPVFSPTNLQGGNTNILFVTGGNALTYPAADGNINGFRAYFLLHDVPAAGVRAFAMSFDDDATSIETIDHSPLNIDHSVYDLQGRRMANGQSSTVNGQSLKKGVYIVNGKKTVIK